MSSHFKASASPCRKPTASATPYRGAIHGGTPSSAVVLLAPPSGHYFGESTAVNEVKTGFRCHQRQQRVFPPRKDALLAHGAPAAFRTRKVHLALAEVHGPERRRLLVLRRRRTDEESELLAEGSQAGRGPLG